MTKREPFPWLTLSISACCLLLPLLGASFDEIALTRTGVLEAGEWWRLFTGHLVHGGGEHLFWDVAAFAALGSQAERRLGPRPFAALLAFAALVVSIGTLALVPRLDWYCGISGLDTALFAWLLTVDWRGARLECALGAALLAAKIAYEFATGSMLFVQEPGLLPVPEAHLLGAAAGLLIALQFGVRFSQEPS